MSNGQPIVIRAAVKPISTLPRPLPSADLLTGEPVEKAHYERSDISVVPAAGVVAEAMTCLTLADFILDKFGGDSLDELKDNLARYRRARSAAPPAARKGGCNSSRGASGSSSPGASARASGAAPAESE
jgi:chorismate synthase